MALQDTFGGSVGLGEQVSYDTPVAITNWVEIVSCGLARAQDRQPEGTLGRSSDRGRVARRKYLATDNSAGDLVVEPNYNDSFAMLLKHAMGVVNTVGGPAPFTHNFTLGDLSDNLTVEKQWNSVSSEIFTGCKIGNWTLTVDAGSLAQATFSLLSKTSGGIVAATSPTYVVDPDPIKYSDAGSLSFNGNTYGCIKSLTVTVNNGIDVRPVLGEATSKEFAPTAKREITLSIDIEWDSVNSLYADYLAGVDSDVTITFTGAIAPNALAITLHNAHISEHPGHSLAGPEVVVDTVTFMAKSDGTNLGLLLALTNANALPTDN